MLASGTEGSSGCRAVEIVALRTGVWGRGEEECIASQLKVDDSLNVMNFDIDDLTIKKCLFGLVRNKMELKS